MPLLHSVRSGHPAAHGGNRYAEMVTWDKECLFTLNKFILKINGRTVVM